MLLLDIFFHKFLFRLCFCCNKFENFVLFVLQLSVLVRCQCFLIFYHFCLFFRFSTTCFVTLIMKIFYKKLLKTTIQAGKRKLAVWKERCLFFLTIDLNDDMKIAKCVDSTTMLVDFTKLYVLIQNYLIKVINTCMN